MTPKHQQKMSTYQHEEAFCLMKYESEDRRITELIWNSRDGVTPFCIHSKDGKVELRHADWRADRRVPDHILQPGDRYFTDLTPETAKRYAAQRIDSCKGTEFEVPAEELDERIAILTKSMMDLPGQPDIAVFRLEEAEKWRQKFLTQRDEATGNTWIWQGDGEDNIASLSCPILIQPAQLRAILTAPSRMRTEIADMCADAIEGRWSCEAAIPAIVEALARKDGES